MDSITSVSHFSFIPSLLLLLSIVVLFKKILMGIFIDFKYNIRGIRGQKLSLQGQTLS